MDSAGLCQYDRYHDLHNLCRDERRRFLRRDQDRNRQSCLYFIHRACQSGSAQDAYEQIRTEQPLPDIFPQDLNFEDFCFRCAVLKQPMHTYVHPERFDFWFNLFMMPLGSEGNLHYCTYSQQVTRNADSEQMSNTSASIATDVLNTCIKLRGAVNFQHTMDEVIPI